MGCPAGIAPGVATGVAAGAARGAAAGVATGVDAGAADLVAGVGAEGCCANTGVVTATHRLNNKRNGIAFIAYLVISPAPSCRPCAARAGSPASTRRRLP